MTLILKGRFPAKENATENSSRAEAPGGRVQSVMVRSCHTKNHQYEQIIGGVANIKMGKPLVLYISAYISITCSPDASWRVNHLLPLFFEKRVDKSVIVPFFAIILYERDKFFKTALQAHMEASTKPLRG